jgi:O-antigen ligase
MKKYIPLIFLSLIFFTFLIGRVQNAYDRIHPQFLYLGIIDLFLILHIFYKFSLVKIYDVIKENKIFIFYSTYIFLSLISILFALNKIESLIVISQYLTFFFSYFIIIVITSLYKVDVVKTVIYLSVISLLLESMTVLYAVFDYVVVNGNPYLRSNEYSGLAANINITAFSLVVKSSFIYYLLFRRKNKLITNIFLYVILFMVFTTLSFMLSRGAILAFFMLNILILSFVIFKRNHYKNSITKIIGLLTILFFSYIMSNSIMSNDSSSNVLVDRVSSISLDTRDQSIGERLRFYKLSTQIIGENLLTGIGIGNWKFKSIEYDASNLQEYRVPYHAHNDFLQVASEIGVFGFLCFLAIFLIPIIGTMKYVFKFRRLIGVCFLGSLLVYTMDSMLNFPISRPISHVYFLFILVGYQNLIKLK